MSQLQSTGLLLIEEVEWIETENQTFRTYLDIVTTMLADQKNDLYLGPILDNLPKTTQYHKVYSQIRDLPVANHQAATMFYMNIQTWKHRPFIQENYDAGLIDDLEKTLQQLTQVEDNTSHIQWGMRQIIFQATS